MNVAEQPVLRNAGWSRSREVRQTDSKGFLGERDFSIIASPDLTESSLLTKAISEQGTDPLRPSEGQGLGNAFSSARFSSIAEKGKPIKCHTPVESSLSPPRHVCPVPEALHTATMPARQNLYRRVDPACCVISH